MWERFRKRRENELSFLGGCLGLGLASITVRWIAAESVGVGFPYWTEFSIDYLVVVELVFRLPRNALSGS